MTRSQWTNLWRAYRWMKRRVGAERAFAWCCGYDHRNYPVLKRLS